MVLSPEHPLVDEVTGEAQAEAMAPTANRPPPRIWSLGKKSKRTRPGCLPAATA